MTNRYTNSFIFQQWENRAPCYALMKLEEEKICAFEKTWGTARSKGIRTAMVVTFGGGWWSVMIEASKQTLRYGGRKALGAATGLVCGYFGSTSIILVTKSVKVVKCAKICHELCSGGLDIAELCATTPIHLVEIAIFGRPVLVREGDGFSLFSTGPSDPVKEIEKLFTSKK